MAKPRRRLIADAPRDGSRLRLWGTREPTAFVGYYNRLFAGWVPCGETCPLLRHDLTHWAPWEPPAS